MKISARVVLLAAPGALAACAAQDPGAPTASTSDALSVVRPAATVALGGAHVAADAPPSVVRPDFCNHAVKDQKSGPTLSNPIIVNLFMGQYWMTPQGVSDMNAVDAAWKALAGQAELYQPVSEYVSAGVGSFWGSDWVGFGADQGQNGQVNQVQEDLIQSFVDFELEQNRAPAPQSSRTLYFVYIGKGAYSQYDTTNGFNGHHHWYASQQAHQTVHYAVIDYEPRLSTYTQVAYHELMEAITDPEGNAYYDASLGEGEIGDFCEVDSAYGSYTLQQIWSQRACACISPPQPSFVIPVHLRF